MSTATTVPSSETDELFDLDLRVVPLDEGTVNKTPMLGTGTCYNSWCHVTWCCQSVGGAMCPV